MNLSSKPFGSKLFALLLAAALALTGSAAYVLADDAVAHALTNGVAVQEDATLTATISVDITGEGGVAETWLAPTQVSVPAGTDALTATLQALDAAGMTYETSTSEWGTSLDAIISADGTRLALDYDENYNYIYWQFLVNSAYSNIGSSSYILSAGDSISWHYGVSNAATNPAGPDYDTTTVPENVAEAWSRFEEFGNVFKSETEASYTNTVVDWKSRIGNTTGVSEIVIADGYLFVAVGSSWDPTATASPYAMQLVKIDAQTGEVVATTPLAGDINYTCRPLIAHGLVYVPLNGGAVQAVNATTMKTYWVSAAAEDGGQVTTTLALHRVMASTGEYDENWNPVMEETELLFFGTAVYDAVTGTYSCGSIVALDPLTGMLHSEWCYTNTEAGFYWTNTIELFGSIYVGDTAGKIHRLSAGSWGVQDELYYDLSFENEADSRVVADMALYWNDGYHLLVASNDGTLTCFDWDVVGNQTSYGRSVRAISNCKSGPVVVNNKVIIGGMTLDGSAAAVAVIDPDTMNVEQVISTVDGQALPSAYGNGVCAPVLALNSVSDGKVVCYFTVNYGVNDPDDPTYSTYIEGGNVYCFVLGEDEAHLFYAPESGVNAQFCDSPLVMDGWHTLYYLNDSGYIVKLDDRLYVPTPADDEGDDNKEEGQPGQEGQQGQQPAQEGQQASQQGQNNNQRGGQGVPATGEAESVVGAVALGAGIVLACGVILRRKEFCA